MWANLSCLRISAYRHHPWFERAFNSLLGFSCLYGRQQADYLSAVRNVINAALKGSMPNENANLKTA